MASIDTKHSYRFGFLKSEHWEYIRKFELSRKQARCEICHKQDWSNDVHHVVYRKSLFKSQYFDFKVLCRSCHQIVHIVMAHRKRMGARDNKCRYWRNIKRSANRIHKMGLRVGPFFALERAKGIFTNLELTRSAVNEDVLPLSLEHNRLPSKSILINR